MEVLCANGSEKAVIELFHADGKLYKISKICKPSDFNSTDDFNFAETNCLTDLGGLDVVCALLAKGCRLRIVTLCMLWIEWILSVLQRLLQAAQNWAASAPAAASAPSPPVAPALIVAHLAVVVVFRNPTGECISSSCKALVY